MSQVVRTQITCPHCGQTFPAVVEQIIDVGRDPQAKARFLSGRTNMITCPNCGNTFAVGTPLVYHDPGKDLLLVYVPMELNINPTERERVIGDLTRRVTDSIKPENRRAYLLQPRQALTLPGMLDTILDADGITAEVREAQRDKMRVIESFLQVRPEQWPSLVEEHDAAIDHEFLQMVLATAENAAETGQEPMAEILLRLYNFLIEHSTVGQEVLRAAQAQEETVREVAAELEALGDAMTRENFTELVLRYAGDDERLQALVGLMRPALDYQFFQDLTARIDSAQDAERTRLEGLRTRLMELIGLIDRQTQQVLQRAADTLRVIVNSEDLDAAIRPRLDQIDDTFLAVLQANIQAARQKKDEATAARLEEVLHRVMEVLRESAPPQIKLINELMTAESDDAAQALIAQRAPRFGPELLQVMDAVVEDLEEGGQNDNAAKLRRFRDVAADYVQATPQMQPGADRLT